MRSYVPPDSAVEHTVIDRQSEGPAPSPARVGVGGPWNPAAHLSVRKGCRSSFRRPFLSAAFLMTLNGQFSLSQSFLINL